MIDKILSWTTPTTVIDIGANIGAFSLQIKQKIATASIHMIEANPFCEHLLQSTGIPYTIAALSDKEEVKSLFLEKRNTLATGASLFKENTNWYADGAYFEMPVQTKLLDDLNLFQGEQIELMKLDVQGSELAIMKGGTETISRTNWICLEVSLVEYNDGAPGMKEVTEWLQNRGFELKDIVEYHFDRGNIFQLDLLFRNSNI